jgi:large subunit ribosomal protein L29
MKASDLRDRTTEDLKELERSLAEERFSGRFKNFTNRLDDTSLIRKNRRDLARVKFILAERARGEAPAPTEKKAEPAVARPKAPKPAPRAPTAAKAETGAQAKAEVAAKPASRKSAAPAAAAGNDAPAKKTKGEPKRSAKGKAKSTEKTESK